MPRNFKDQIGKTEFCLSSIYGEHGSRSDVSLRQANTQSRGDTANIKRLTKLF